MLRSSKRRASRSSAASTARPAIVCSVRRSSRSFRFLGDCGSRYFRSRFGRSWFVVRRSAFDVAHDEPRTTNREPSTTHDERRTKNDRGLLTRIGAMLASAHQSDVPIPVRLRVPNRTPGDWLSADDRGPPHRLRPAADFRARESGDRATCSRRKGARSRRPPGQGCCGALALHAGRLDEARAMARRDDRGVRSRRAWIGLP